MKRAAWESWGSLAHVAAAASLGEGFWHLERVGDNLMFLGYSRGAGGWWRRAGAWMEAKLDEARR